MFPVTTSVEGQFKLVRTPTLASCLCFTLFWAGHAFAIDWPQWRGPNRAAAWTESGIVEKLPNTGLKVLWRAPVAMGYSSPVIAAGKVYLSDAELNKPMVRERVHCLEADSGKMRWSYCYETPAPDWFFTDDQARGPGATPIVINAGGVRQLIVWTQQSVSSLNPANGKLYWREATSTGGSPGTAGVSTPVFQDSYLLVSGWMFQLEKDRPGGKTLWPEGKGVSRRILSDTSTGLLLGDYVYSAKAGGDFLCLKAATGEEIWKTSAVTDLINGASIHVTVHGDSAFLFNDRGELIQARLAPSGYEEISRTKLIEPTSPFGGRKVAWAAPAFAHQNVYARNDQELICVSLAANSYTADRRGK